MRASRAATGKVAWTLDNKGGQTIASPAVRGGVVYFPTSDGTRFKAIEDATGAVKLDLQNRAVSFSSPVDGNGVLFVGGARTGTCTRFARGLCCGPLTRQ